ncbi:MAG: phosphoribosylformylglycinamidine synthase subunit PurL [Deltaproteobacteria bacterium]|jgi:phosphoribosylformylglycinamidine synthase|nr:phosphoribosylformylglycinamidine synthase subunit PurL [Deltaproteobacteria bacterium]
MSEEALEDKWSEHGLTEEEYKRLLRILGRQPNYLELALFGVMWSEHCCYKHSKGELRKLPTEAHFVLQGPGENAGIVDVGEGVGVVFKIESHNHPSAIEPYQGAATGVGGIIRDIFTMGARPAAILDSLRFGPLEGHRVKGLLNGVVAGIGGYGNCMGIPNVGGETFFHPAYSGNPLVNAMCVGFVDTNRVFRGRATGPGNLVLLVGSRTGRDGIKGASFASVELSDSDPDKRHNVQVGDPFMEKLVMEATLEILENGLAVGVQDLGAAGLTCSGCEMASRGRSGIALDLDLVPLREDGLLDWEIMLSESQERMLMVVEPGKLDRVRAICDKWDVPCTAIGKVTDDDCFVLRRGQKVLAVVPSVFLTDKAPAYQPPMSEPPSYQPLKKADVGLAGKIQDIPGLLKKLLASPNIASKRWVYEQYDCTVGANTVLAPSGDAAVLRIPGTRKGLAVTCDCNSRFVALDPYWGTAMAVAEAALNVAVTGARPLAITNCLNFGSPENPEVFWQFSKAVDGLAEAARRLGTPITGGNVSFYNEYDGVPVYPTPVIGMVGVMDDVDNRVPHHFRKEGDHVFLVGRSLEEFGGSELHWLLAGRDEGHVPFLNLDFAARLNAFLADCAKLRYLESAHDCSEGGLAVALLESAATLGLGVSLDWADNISPAAALFGETCSRALVSVSPEKLGQFMGYLQDFNLPHTQLGRVAGDGLISVRYNGAGLLHEELKGLLGLWEGALAGMAGI